MKGGLTIVKARIIAQFSNVHFVQPRFELFPICFSQELGFAGRLSKGARCDILSKGCGFCSMGRPILKSARKKDSGGEGKGSKGSERSGGRDKK